MIAVDTSVVVAAFGAWHERHDVAREVLRLGAALPAHCGIEAYSTLTRLPDPFRAAPDVVAEYLERRFGDGWLEPDAARVRSLPATLADAGIVGGACYDAVVAITAMHHGLVLHTLDRRAERMYRRGGTDHRLLG